MASESVGPFSRPEKDLSHKQCRKWGVGRPRKDPAFAAPTSPPPRSALVERRLARARTLSRRSPASIELDVQRVRGLEELRLERRADLLWGTLEEAQKANVDSFFFTNITPQLDDFNQSTQHGLWGELEDAIFADTDIEDLRVSVLGGPILKTTDLPYRDVLVPRSFWKIIVYVEVGALRAKAFVLTQDDLEAKLESLGLEPFRVYQLTVAELAKLTALDYGGLATADAMSGGPEALGAPTVRRIESRADIVLG